MKYANWNVPERGAEIPRALLAAGCTPLLAAILRLRGLSDPAAARSFLRGGAETLTNPLELTGMVDAVQRLTRAVATGEHVAVYGDYDVDGITAACLLTDYLRFRGLTCELKIPDRIRDGYGLNAAAIDTLAEKGVTLIVTVDCGVTNLEETAYAAQRGVDIVLLDVLLPDGDGLAHVETFSQLPGRPDVIIITGHGNADAAEAALRSGAWEYLVKPLRVRDLSKALTQAVQWRNSRDSQSRSLLRHPDIIGKSPALAEALEALREAAASNVNVLITGETGTGKELFASALHANSLRASGPFVTVDCTTLPETLVEAHLFGHARGAFTGADRAREGLLAAADHGTLFLDEVGELPLPVQGAFLRALELRRFRPVGEVREVESDFRLVAATNRDLDDMVGMDLYRSDLRFRLRGMTIHVPPLRRRAEDIPLLAEHFTARYCQRHELPNKELTPDCYAMLADYSWPGNVRELRHTIERACAAAGDGTQLFTRHLPTEIRIELARKRLVHLSEPEESAPTAPLPEQEPSTQPRKPETFPTLRDMKAKAERDYIAGLFAACQGDVRRAAGIAGVSRGHFYELLKKYGLDRTSSIPEFPAI